MGGGGKKVGEASNLFDELIVVIHPALSQISGRFLPVHLHGAPTLPRVRRILTPTDL